jgi:hypothetical protein
MPRTLEILITPEVAAQLVGGGVATLVAFGAWLRSVWKIQNAKRNLEFGQLQIAAQVQRRTQLENAEILRRLEIAANNAPPPVVVAVAAPPTAEATP